jgi:hypothetical protein
MIEAMLIALLPSLTGLITIGLLTAYRHRVRQSTLSPVS